MNRIAVPAAFLLVMSALVAALAVWILADDGGGTPSVAHPTPAPGACGDGTGFFIPKADGTAGSARYFSEDEIVARAERRLGQAIQLPPPPNWSHRTAFETIDLDEQIGDAQSERTRHDAAIVYYVADDESAPLLTLQYQPLPSCRPWGRPETRQIGDRTIDVHISSGSGGKSYFNGDEHVSFDYEVATASLELDALTIIITLEWDETRAPPEDERLAELDRWIEAVFVANTVG